MGSAIKTLSELINTRKQGFNETKPLMYAFVLYSKNDTNFNQYILNNYHQMQLNSQFADIFVLESPERWHNGINPSKIISGQNKSKLNLDLADITLKYFDIKEAELPALVLFSSLNESRWGVISLRSLPKDSYNQFITKVLREIKERLNRFTQRNRVNSQGYVDNGFVMNFLFGMSSLQKDYIGLKYKLVGETNVNDNVLFRLENLQAELREMRSEIRGGFQSLSNKLDWIKQDLAEFKITFSKKIQSLKNDNNSHCFEEEYENLLTEYDDKMLESSMDIARETDRLISEEFSNTRCVDGFEKESRSMINSGLRVYEFIKGNEVQDFDFSVCAAGMWKAVEVELNIVLIDAIRLLKEFVPGIPSYGNPHRGGRCDVFAGYKFNERYFVNINKQINRQFSKIMFGDMIRISEHWQENECTQLLQAVAPNVSHEIFYDINDFMNEFVRQFKRVVYEFRNECSHTGVMSKSQFLDMKDVLMSDKGLFFRIAELKKAIYRTLS